MMIYHVIFNNDILDEISNFIRGLREAFWEVADRTERSRARLRLLRQREELRSRESLGYRQLGKMGFQLLTEGVSVTKTPDTTALLDEIQRLAVRQREVDRRLVVGLIELSQHEWQRLARQLECGEAVFRSLRLGDDIPGPSWKVGVPPPPGFCLVINRNNVPHQMSEGMGYQSGDILLIVMPVSMIQEWETWAGGTSTDFVDKLGTTVLKTLP